MRTINSYTGFTGGRRSFKVTCFFVQLTGKITPDTTELLPPQSTSVIISSLQTNKYKTGKISAALDS